MQKQYCVLDKNGIALSWTDSFEDADLIAQSAAVDWGCNPCRVVDHKSRELLAVWSHADH